MQKGDIGQLLQNRFYQIEIIVGILVWSMKFRKLFHWLAMVAFTSRDANVINICTLGRLHINHYIWPVYYYIIYDMITCYNMAAPVVVWYRVTTLKSLNWLRCKTRLSSNPCWGYAIICPVTNNNCRSKPAMACFLRALFVQV